MEEYQFHQKNKKKEGLLSLVGACAEIEFFTNLLDQIVAEREKPIDRQVDILLP